MSNSCWHNYGFFIDKTAHIIELTSISKVSYAKFLATCTLVNTPTDDFTRSYITEGYPNSFDKTYLSE